MGASRFNDMEIDAIGEIMNISLGASATAVSTMLGTMVDITTPKVRVLNGEEFEFKKLEPAIGVEIAYIEGLEGSNVMMFSRDDVRVIVGMLMGAEIPPEQFEMDEINRSAICEVMNQMMGSSATALSEFLGTSVNISTPISFEIPDEDSFKSKYFQTDEYKVVVRFSLKVEGRMESQFLNIMSQDLAKRLLEPYSEMFGALETAKPEPKPEPVQESPELTEAPSGDHVMSPDEIAALLAQENTASASEPSPAPTQTPVTPTPDMSMPQQPMFAQQPMYQMPAMQDPMVMQLLSQMQQSQMQMMEMMNSMREKKEKARTAENPSVIRPVNPSHLTDESGDADEDAVNQEMLMKVPLEISVEIGRTKKLVKDILEFTQGSLVVLDKMAGEQAELYVNGQCIARGDIVVVEDNFGIRITEIVSRNLNPESL